MRTQKQAQIQQISQIEKEYLRQAWRLCTIVSNAKSILESREQWKCIRWVHVLDVLDVHMHGQVFVHLPADSTHRCRRSGGYGVTTATRGLVLNFGHDRTDIAPFHVRIEFSLGKRKS